MEPTDRRETPRRPRGSTLALCGALSLVAHLGLVTLLVWMARDALWVPNMDVVWLDLDNVLGAPSPAPATEATQQLEKPAPTPRAPSTPDQKAATKRPVRARPSDRRAKRGGNAAPELTRLAPGQAALILVLRCDRIRHSRYADDVRALLHVFYDHKLLLRDSGIDPLTFKALLIATPNPYRVTRTFLAARHALPTDDIKRAIERAVVANGGTLRWREGEIGILGRVSSPPRLSHDPRLVAVTDGLLMVVDSRLHRELSAHPMQPEARSRRRPTETMLDLLQDIDQLGGEGKQRPALLLQAVNVSRLIRLPPGIPPPSDVRLTIPATTPTHARGQLTFATAAQATLFAATVRAQLDAAARSLMLRLAGLSPLLRAIKLARRGRTIAVDVVLSPLQVRQVLVFFRGIIPQVTLPGRPQPPPEPPLEADPSHPPPTG